MQKNQAVPNFRSLIERCLLQGLNEKENSCESDIDAKKRISQYYSKHAGEISKHRKLFEQEEDFKTMVNMKVIEEFLKQ